MIKSISVMLNSIRAVTRFVEANAVTKAEVKVDITEEITVPGDSIMGLFATNLLKPLQVEIKAENGRDIEKLLEKYDQENITFIELEGE